MGNDGGSIPTRRELVKEAARNPTSAQLKETQQEQAEWSWQNCPLSHKPLVRPVVGDAAGRLYNKDAVLEFLLPGRDGEELGRKDREEVLGGRVRGLRDVVEVRFEVEDAAEGEERREKWVCPVTGKRLGPQVKAVYLVPCGHAFSETAVREVKGGLCLQCNEPYTTDNVIPILSTSPVDVERLAARAKSLKEQGLTHALKKAPGSSKKRKKHAAVAEEVATNGQSQPSTNKATATASSTPHDTSKSGTPQPTSGASTPAPVSLIKNAATASLTAKVMQDEEQRKKRQKLGMNDNLKGLFSSGSGGEVGKNGKSGDFMTRGYSIPAGAKR